MWIGANKHLMEKVGDLTWNLTSDPIKILGITFGSEMPASLVNENWERKIEKNICLYFAVAETELHVVLHRQNPNSKDPFLDI